MAKYWLALGLIFLVACAGGEGYYYGGYGYPYDDYDYDYGYYPYPSEEYYYSFPYMAPFGGEEFEEHEEHEFNGDED